MTVKRSLPEMLLPVQTRLGALRKSQGEWERPLSLGDVLELWGGAQHQGTRGYGGQR